MATSEGSVTVARIRIEQREEEALMVAESSLLGERAACWARLVLVIALGLSTGPLAQLTNQSFPSDHVRPFIVVGYVFFTVYFWLLLRRVKPSVKAGFYVPFFFMTVDCAFIALMGWRTAASGAPPKPELLCAMLSVQLAFSIARSSRWHVVVATALTIATYFMVASLEGWASLIPSAMVVSAFLTFGGLILWANRRVRSTWIEVRRRENLAHFLPRQVAARVLRAGGVALQPVQREVTILFSDIRDFTTMSEKLAPKEVLAFLDDYFGHMSQIVKGHEGMVNKFIGDGLMAVWGVPDFQDDHAVRAVRAAIDMRRKLSELNQERIARGEQVIRVGIGVHSGMVAAGMLGGADQHEYTVIGDAVNVASRIEGLTKELSTDLLVSESTWALLGQRFSGQRIGDEKVKGRLERVVVYAVESIRVAAA